MDGSTGGRLQFAAPASGVQGERDLLQAMAPKEGVTYYGAHGADEPAGPHTAAAYESCGAAEPANCEAPSAVVPCIKAPPVMSSASKWKGVPPPQPKQLAVKAGTSSSPVSASLSSGIQIPTKAMPGALSAVGATSLPPVPLLPPPSSSRPLAAPHALKNFDSAQASNEPVHAPAQSVVCKPALLTQEQLRNMAPTRGIGGKAACQKQRELRERLLGTLDVRETDLTDSDFNWKAVLKSLPTAVGADVVGTGVCKFTFRLLRDVRDPNYIKIDSGERHVFEVTRTDGSAVHLHFHKSGRCDKPQTFHRVPVEIGAAEPDRVGANAILAPPATLDDIKRWETPGDNLPMGRNEVAMALENLLQITRQGTHIQAVNVTDGIALLWQRFLRNTIQNKEIIRNGIIAAYVMGPHDGPQLVFCHPDSSYTRVSIRGGDTHVEHSGAGRWQDLAILQRPVYFDKSWMQIRDER